MEIVFIRHGEGEHTLALPKSLNLADPKLTAVGRTQVIAVRDMLAVGNTDVVLTSPTRRTIETALLLTETSKVAPLVTPAVGPRMFPQYPRPSPATCDQLLPRKTIVSEFPSISFLRDDDDQLWTEGINSVPPERFACVASSLISWCRAQGLERVIVVAHDGTIHSYREFLGEKNLTRDTFLGDAGSFRCFV